MILRPFLNDESSCASYLFGCLTHAQLAVVDPHADLVDAYLEAAAAIGAPITAVFETHVQADHVSGLPALVERTGARAYLPIDAGVDFEHHALADGDEVEMGNTIVRALSTPGHAPAHHAYLVSDLRRGTREPWLAFTGDSLLIGDVGRPDLHVAGDPAGQARLLHGSLARLLELADGVVVLPSHYAGLGLRPRALGQPVLLDRLRAQPERDAGLRRRRRVRRGTAARTRRRGRPSRRRSWRTTAAAPLPRRGEHDADARPARERRAVRAAGRAQRARRRDGRPRAQRPAARRRAGLQAHLDGGHPRLRGRLRPRQGDHEPRRRRARRPRRAQAAAGARLAGGAAGAAAHRARAVVELHRRRQHPARHQPGPRLVDDGRDEDRPRRARPPRSRRSASTRPPATWASPPPRWPAARSPRPTRRAPSSGSARR